MTRKARHHIRSLFEELRGRPSAGVALGLGALLAARTAALQLLSLPLAIHWGEGHQWREAFTYGVAWNYAHGPLGLDALLHPRMFVFHAKSNIVPMEPPLYPLVSSVLMRLSGDSLVGPRLLSFAGLLVTAFVLWRWLGLAMREGGASPAKDDAGWEEKAGLLLALALAPSVAVEFRQVQPEATCAGLATAAAFFASRYARGEGRPRRQALLAVVLASLAVLVKPLALGVLPGVVAFAGWGPLGGGAWKAAIRRAVVVGAGIAIGLVPYVAWDRWSHHLQATEMDGAFFIAIEHDWKEMLKNVATLKYAREAFFFFLPSYASATWLAPALVAGLYRALSNATLRRWAVPLLVWLAGYMVELLAVGDRLHSNAYYFTLAPMPLAFFVALGVGAMLRVLGTPGRKPLPLFQAGLLAALLLPASAFMVRSWRWTNTIDVAALGLEKNRNMWGDDIGLGRMLLAVIVVFALAPLMRPRRIPEGVGLVLVATILGSGAWAIRDQAQYFRYYVAADRRATWAAETEELRALVDRHSRRDDRVVVAPGWSASSPNLLPFQAVLRNGFPVVTGTDPLDVAAFRARGATLYVRFDEPGAEVLAVPGKLLGQVGLFRVTCLADDGCPPTREPR